MTSQLLPNMQGARESLSQIQRLQRDVDSVCWTTSGEGRAKTRHIGFHLTIAAGKIARIEERADHGVIDESVLDDVAADLFVYALQLADLRAVELWELYHRRVTSNLDSQTRHA